MSNTIYNLWCSENSMTGSREYMHLCILYSYVKYNANFTEKSGKHRENVAFCAKAKKSLIDLKIAFYRDHDIAKSWRD